MASVIYPKAKESFLSQSPSIDLDTDTIKVTILSSSDHTYSAADQYFSDVTDYSGVTPQTLSNKTVTSGVFDNTADHTFTSVTIDGTKDVDQVIVYKDTGTPSTSPLIAYFDGFTAVTPDGGNIDLAWASGGIFAL